MAQSKKPKPIKPEAVYVPPTEAERLCSQAYDLLATAMRLTVTDAKRELTELGTDYFDAATVRKTIRLLHKAEQLNKVLGIVMMPPY